MSVNHSAREVTAGLIDGIVDSDQWHVSRYATCLLHANVLIYVDAIRVDAS